MTISWTLPKPCSNPGIDDGRAAYDFVRAGDADHRHPLLVSHAAVVAPALALALPIDHSLAQGDDLARPLAVRHALAMQGLGKIARWAGDHHAQTPVDLGDIFSHRLHAA